MRLRSIRILGLGFMASCLLPLPLRAAQAQTANRPSQAQTTPRAPRPKPGPGGAIPMPEDRAEDSYAIYSMLMPGQIFASMPPSQSSRWAIAQITISLEDRSPAVPPQAQLKPPPEHARWFQDALGDYEANKHVRVQLRQEPFKLGHAFTLLNPDQVAALRAAKTSTTATSEAQTEWGGYPGITFFSEVYFEPRHRAALVFMNDWCAQLCAAGSWIYLEKQGGHWVRRSGVVSPGA